MLLRAAACHSCTLPLDHHGIEMDVFDAADIVDRVDPDAAA